MTNFRKGARVIVPWGLNEIEGVVVDIFGPSVNPVVTVRIELDGEDGVEEHTDIGFRAAHLRPAATVTHS